MSIRTPSYSPAGPFPKFFVSPLSLRSDLSILLSSPPRLHNCILSSLCSAHYHARIRLSAAYGSQFQIRYAQVRSPTTIPLQDIDLLSSSRLPWLQSRSSTLEITSPSPRPRTSACLFRKHVATLQTFVASNQHSGGPFYTTYASHFGSLYASDLLRSPTPNQPLKHAVEGVPPLRSKAAASPLTTPDGATSTSADVTQWHSPRTFLAKNA
ncbi:hypothetical protein BOTBODRAFT_57508 [Botryobasidium botryosum FD-172 SS1]|uniref:Uncharacterized protein n=1 Tax=Botryobasidium botryosum (strain FD-172 SS1) TaxID=930990 RepID=A0A067M6L1_BOTB1|nr:hypothetical protein BOTBODRAFT_57508 [Botryobasidium botryosum FD-172 SS1]